MMFENVQKVKENQGKKAKKKKKRSKIIVTSLKDAW